MHNLVKNENRCFRCSICCWEWKSKPTSACPGVLRYRWGDRPAHLKTSYELSRENLKPKVDSLPLGCIWHATEAQWLWLYDRLSAETDNPDLPPVISWKSGIPENLKTEGQLRKENLFPKPGAKPRECFSVYDRKFEEIIWVFLYHTDDCEWQAQDNYICKKTLKVAYLLSDGWIKRLGEPDLEVENKRYRQSNLVKLYSRRRVEAFLASNAEMYCEWLSGAR